MNFDIQRQGGAQSGALHAPGNVLVETDASLTQLNPGIDPFLYRLLGAWERLSCDDRQLLAEVAVRRAERY